MINTTTPNILTSVMIPLSAVGAHGFQVESLVQQVTRLHKGGPNYATHLVRDYLERTNLCILSTLQVLIPFWR